MSWWGMPTNDSDILVGYGVRSCKALNVTQRLLVQVRGRDVLLGYGVIGWEMTINLSPHKSPADPSSWHDWGIIQKLPQCKYLFDETILICSDKLTLKWFSSSWHSSYLLQVDIWAIFCKYSGRQVGVFGGFNIWPGANVCQLMPLAVDSRWPRDLVIWCKYILVDSSLVLFGGIVSLKCVPSVTLVIWWFGAKV